MVNGIGQDHRIGEQNKKQIYNTTDTSSSPSTPSYSSKKLNEYTDISRKKIHFRDTL